MRATVIQTLSRALMGLALCAGCAYAGSFAVSPIRAELSAQRAVDSLTVRNDGTESVSIQLQTNSWSQQDGTDVESPTTELIASPPIFSLEPGASQVIRVGLRKPQAGPKETTYRLLLQELPPPPSVDFQGLKVALALSVPVFVAPAVPAQEALDWQVQQTASGQLQVQLRNEGNVHARIAEFEITSATGDRLGRMETASYVLAGQWRSWTLPTIEQLPGGSRLRISANTTRGQREVELVVP